jgi:predicted DsbA family dithiol-disulfide isomerase
MELALYSDFICPFCFIAERGPLARLQREYDVRLDWRGFELRPDTPPEGANMSSRFPAARLSQMRAHMRGVAERAGIHEMGDPERIPNTRRALAMAEYARDQGKLDAFRIAAMDAYWLHDKDLGSAADLAAIASGVGLNGKAALLASLEQGYLDRVLQHRRDGEAMGVDGIPTSFLEGGVVVGAAPYEHFVALAQRAGAKLR